MGEGLVESMVSRMDGSSAGRAWRVAIAFEGALLVVAYLGGVLLGVPFMDRWDWSWEAVGWGVLACIPLWGVFYESVHNESKSLREIRRFMDQNIRPLFERWSTWQLALLSVMAGLGEELLFRGFIQRGLENWGSLTAGLVISSVLFGLAHAMTKAYLLLGILAGFFFGGIYVMTGNLLIPMITHAVYDFVALLYYLRKTTSLEELTEGDEWE